MSDNKQTTPDDCQLQTLYDGAEELTFKEKVRHWMFRIGTAKNRRKERLEKMMRRQEEVNCVIQQEKDTPESASASSPPSRNTFREGELVRVRPWEELSRLLDEHNRTEGLTFMPGMKYFCGKELRVMKKVKMIFDERAWRMLKIKNSYLLEGSVCNSRGLYDREGCDRCCFFFWKDSWLEKVDQKKTPAE